MLNFNYATCIKDVHSWGHDTFYNICDGTEHIVRWGSMDWTSALLIGIPVGVFLLGSVLISVGLVKAVYDELVD